MNHDWKFPLKLMTAYESVVWVIFEKPKLAHVIVLLYKIKSALLFCIDAPVWNKYFKLSLSFTFSQVRSTADTSPTEKQVDLSSTSSGQYDKAQFASCQWRRPGWDTHSCLWVNHRFKVSKSERERNMYKDKVDAHRRNSFTSISFFHTWWWNSDIIYIQAFMEALEGLETAEELQHSDFHLPVFHPVHLYTYTAILCRLGHSRFASGVAKLCPSVRPVAVRYSQALCCQKYSTRSGRHGQLKDWAVSHEFSSSCMLCCGTAPCCCMQGKTNRPFILQLQWPCISAGDVWLWNHLKLYARSVCDRVNFLLSSPYSAWHFICS